MSVTPTRLGTLAIHGGTPVRETLLPYGRQSLDEGDIESVVEVLRSDWLTTGPKVVEFEERFAAWVRAKYAISFSSGTAALHGAAFASGGANPQPTAIQRTRAAALRPHRCIIDASRVA